MAHAAETGTFRGDWVRFIYGTSRIADSTRVLMLALSEAMDESGRVEAARDDIANLLSRAPRRVSSRYTDAISAGVLEQVSRGNRKSGSVFQALIPNGKHVTPGCHMFPRKHVTESRPPSQETCDPRVSHVSQEACDTRGSRVGPNTCPPGVTSSEPPIREGSTTPSEPTLFEVVEPTAQHPAVQAPKRTEGQRVKYLADLYYDAVQGMTDHTKVRSVVKAAITRGISDEELERGLLHHAADGRWALTLDSLRIAVNRSDPSQDNQERRGNLRVVGGSRQEIPDHEHWQNITEEELRNIL